MNIFQSILGWFNKQKQLAQSLVDVPTFTGALLDDRPPEEKTGDIKFTDIVAQATAVNWYGKVERQPFPVYNQNQSYMCGANALSKALGVAYSVKYGVYIPFSRASIYQRRINRPDEGMAMWDMFRIASEGVTLEQLTPETITTDSDADNLFIEPFKLDVGKIFSISGGIYPTNDMETIASIIQQTGKGVILLTYFTAAEWGQQYPKMLNIVLTQNEGLRHFVVAVDFILLNGVKYLIVEDSSWFGGINRRYINETWLKKRVIGCGYPMNFKFMISPSIYKYDGVTIISAQKCLQADGDFPTNVAFIESAGPITRQSVMKFQTKYGLPQTGLLDKATKLKLAQLFP